MSDDAAPIFSEPEFTGQRLLGLIIDVEAAVGSHRAGITPLGRAIIRLCEEAGNVDPELRKR